jgi:hypothetical protein
MPWLGGGLLGTSPRQWTPPLGTASGIGRAGPKAPSLQRRPSAFAGRIGGQISGLPGLPYRYRGKHWQWFGCQPAKPTRVGLVFWICASATSQNHAAW